MINFLYKVSPKWMHEAFFNGIRLQMLMFPLFSTLLITFMSDLQTVMRRNSVYVAFILGGAFVGEKVRRFLPWGCLISWLPPPSPPPPPPPLSLHPRRMPSWLVPASPPLLHHAMQLLTGALDQAWENNNKGVRVLL